MKASKNLTTAVAAAALASVIGLAYAQTEDSAGQPMGSTDQTQTQSPNAEQVTQPSTDLQPADMPQADPTQTQQQQQTQQVQQVQDQPAPVQPQLTTPPAQPTQYSSTPSATTASTTTAPSPDSSTLPMEERTPRADRN